MMVKANGFITVEMEMHKADTSRVFCPLRGAKALEDVFVKLTALCKEFGAESLVVVEYDVQKKAVICDVYEDFENDKVIAEDVSLSKAQRVLEKVIKDRKEAEYRKKVLAEAAEIAANEDAEYFRVHKKEKDPSGRECDYKLVIRNDETDVYYHDSEGWYSLVLDLDSEGWKREYLEVGGDKQ